MPRPWTPCSARRPGIAGKEPEVIAVAVPRS
jgi:hypothetical protein